MGAEPVLFLARGYTGHEHLTVFGLINMNARLYDPALGRFLSPDPYVQSPDNSQNYNRYSYCLNNPLRYSDPSGKIPWNDVIAGVCLVGGIVLEFVPGMQGLGTSLIATGFAHFAYTINQMQSNNNTMTWDQASNMAGINFSGSINFNGPTAKEKNYNNTPIINIESRNRDYNSGGSMTGANGGSSPPQAQVGPSVTFSYYLSMTSVKQSPTNSQWCTYACSESLSNYFSGSTIQDTYANTYNGNKNNTPAYWGDYLHKTMTYTAIGYSAQAASINDISNSLANGYPVLTRVDFGAGGHAIIINGITGYSNGTAILNYMNPDPSAPAFSTMTYQYYITIQLQGISVTGMKY